MASDVTKYFVPRLLAIAGLLVGAHGCNQRHVHEQTAAGPPLAMPSADMSPDDVVRLQMRALAEDWPDGRGIEQCFQFASPANRRITGPVSRFEAMIRSPSFRDLLVQQATLVGRPQIDDNRAAVLTTFVDRQRRVRVFRFVLSRQISGPYTGCWMTDGAIEVTAPAPERPQKLA